MCLTVSPVPLSRTLRRALTALLAGALLGGVSAAIAPPQATGSSTYLCNGYTGCKDAGYANAGYSARNDEMFWRMYSGHNCTNYVAYRMIKAGMSTERPWTGSGMAYNWGFAMSDITDTRPSVGAVAWWNRGVAGAGSSGHVAYVERVLSSTEIVISEDSWSGDFHWRTIVKEGSGWPTGFIHFADTNTVTNKLPPRVVGVPQVGSPLSAGPGTWKPASTVAFQWLANGIAVVGARVQTFTPTVAQLGKAIAVKVTATRAGYTAGSETTAPTAPVVRGLTTNVAAPTLSGDPLVEEVLTATSGSWSPVPETTEVRWRANGVVLEGRTGPTLQLDQSLVGKKITVVEVARRDGYSMAKATSNKLGPVLAGVVEVTTPFTAAGGTRVGSDLTITPGTVAPLDADILYAWLRDGVPISGATAPTYRLTGDDLGHRIGARVTMTKAHYRPLVQTLPYADTVTTSPRLTLRANGKKHGAAVGVRVAAAGVDAPTGRVSVRIGQRTVTGRVVDGFVRVVLTDLKPGDRRVVVSYAGTSVIEAARAVTRVHVTG